MKIILIVLSLFFCTTAKATNCDYKIFRETKINLEICSNYDRIGEHGFLLYKARTKVLNNYIKNKIAKGELKDKKFEISIEDPIYMPYIKLTQEKNGYFVAISGQSYPTLEELITIIDYFAQPDWKPIIAELYRRNDESKETFEARKKTNEQIVSNLFKLGSGRAPHLYQPFSISKRNDISLVYSGDSLKYTIKGTTLPFKVNATPPVKIKNRYLFFEEKHQFGEQNIYVVQDAKTIKTFKIEEHILENHTGEDFRVFVHPKWVNICWSSNESDWLCSYSYDKNEFFLNEKYKQ